MYLNLNREEELLLSALLQERVSQLTNDLRQLRYQEHVPRVGEAEAREELERDRCLAERLLARVQQAPFDVSC